MGTSVNHPQLHLRNLPEMKTYLLIALFLVIAGVSSAQNEEETSVHESTHKTITVTFL